MTPEQEQWLIQAVQTNTQLIQEIQQDRRETQLQISEVREGQAMMAQYFRETLDRFDRRTDEMLTEIRDLRQDYLNHVHHPPVDR